MALLAAMVVYDVQHFLAIWSWLWSLRHAAPFVVSMVFAVCGLFALMVLSYPINELVGAVTRMVLTPTHLRVHFGLATTDVPLDAVTSVVVEQTQWFPWLPASNALTRWQEFHQSFRKKEALRVEWHYEKGRARRVWVYLDDAEAPRERIESLRSSGTGVRVDVVEADGDEADGEEVVATAAARAAKRQRVSAVGPVPQRALCRPPRPPQHHSRAAGHCAQWASCRPETHTPRPNSWIFVAWNPLSTCLCHEV